VLGGAQGRHRLLSGGREPRGPSQPQQHPGGGGVPTLQSDRVAVIASDHLQLLRVLVRPLA
jgi:hypothetical protein